MARLAFTVEQVRSFVAVADSGSVTAAARSLFLSQAAVTQQVRNFERALDLVLLERSGGRVHLTSAGRVVAESARTALWALTAVEETAAGARKLATGTLEVGATPAAATIYLPPLLATFTRAYPGLEVVVTTVNLRTAVDLVHDASLECAVVEGPPDREQLQELVLADDELVVVAASDHPLAGTKRLDRAALVAHRYLAREPGAAIELFAAQILGDAHPGPRRMQLGQMDAVHAAARAGLGYAVLPRALVERDLAEGTLVELPVPGKHRAITAIRRRSRGSPALEAFWATLEVAAGAAPTGPRPAPTARRDRRPA